MLELCKNFSSKLKDGTEFPHRIEVAGWGATTKFGREPASVLQWLAVNVTDFQACKVIKLSLLPSFSYAVIFSNEEELIVNISTGQLFLSVLTVLSMEYVVKNIPFYGCRIII